MCSLVYYILYKKAQKQVCKKMAVTHVAARGGVTFKISLWRALYKIRCDAWKGTLPAATV